MAFGKFIQQLPVDQIVWLLDLFFSEGFCFSDQVG